MSKKQYSLIDNNSEKCLNYHNKDNTNTGDGYGDDDDDDDTNESIKNNKICINNNEKTQNTFKSGEINDINTNTPNTSLNINVINEKKYNQSRSLTKSKKNNLFPDETTKTNVLKQKRSQLINKDSKSTSTDDEFSLKTNQQLISKSFVSFFILFHF
jgi:hypothetical protein